jgi:hypothetical protein
MLAAVQGTGKIIRASGKYKINGCPTATGTIWIEGGGTILVSPGTGISGCGLLLTGAGGTGVQTTTTTNLPLANRSTATTNTINVASVTGFAVGNMVQLGYSDGTYSFIQNNVIQSISNPAVTFVDPIVVPLLTSQSNNILQLSMVSNSVIRDLTFDCSGANVGALNVYALEENYTAYTTNDNIKYLNCNTQGTGNAAGLYANWGFGNSYRRLQAVNSGSYSVNAIAMYYQSHWATEDLDATNSPAQAGLGAGYGGFGIGFNFAILGNAVNTHASGNYARNVKLQGAGWNNFTNTIGDGSFRNTGLAVSVGSYQNKFYGVSASFNTGASNGVGVWLNGQDNEYNTFYGVTALSNTDDVYWTSTDAFNVFHEVRANTLTNGAGASQFDFSGNNRLDFAGDTTIPGLLWCSGNPPGSATMYMNVITPGACAYNGSAPWALNYITVPVAGWIRHLRVTARIGGLNSSSGFFQIGLVGFGGVGVTCTLGVATACSDDTHWYHVTAGQQIYVVFSNVVGDTLADITVSFEY